MARFFVNMKSKVGGRHSRLTTRILVIMLLPLVLFLIGLFSVGLYKDVLIQAELDALERQGIVLARSLALAEVDSLNKQRQIGARSASDGSSVNLSRETMKQLLPLVGYGSILRARVFQPDGTLAADTARDGLSAVPVQLEFRRNSRMGQKFSRSVLRGLNRVSSLIGGEKPMPVIKHGRIRSAQQFRDVYLALKGTPNRSVFLNSQRQMVLSVTLPVKDVRMVRGALLLTTSGGRIEQEIQSVQWVFLQLFGFVFLITTALALYLARSITLPIAKLAGAADKLRRSHDGGSLARLPDRNDEIGDLSQALSEMTDELQRRIQATAGFAADVAHELKNPLTSLRSAVETVARVEDPVQQRKLMDIILADVGRLDRLITDISLSSRIDVELNRILPEPVDFVPFIENWVAASQQRHTEITLQFDQALTTPLPVRMFLGRIVQVLDNLLQNAISFSPPNGKITISLTADNTQLCIALSDQGPGVPDAKLEAIFDRFYTERPEGEAFGNHSGLGLSISRQIAEAHNGSLTAKNLTPTGASFILTLPISNESLK